MDKKSHALKTEMDKSDYNSGTIAQLGSKFRYVDS